MKTVTFTLVLKLNDNHNPEFWLPDTIRDCLLEGEEVLDFESKVETE